MLQILLVLHFFLELIFGILFLFAPERIPVSFFQNLPAPAQHLARMYAFAALAMAVLGFQAWWHYPERHALLVSLLTLAVFHTGIALSQIFNPMNSSEPYLAGVFHSLFAFGFWVYYFKEL